MVYNIKMCLLPIPTEPCPDEYQKLGELTGKTHTLCQYEKVGKGVCRLYKILELIVNTKAVISLLSLPIIYLYGDELMLSVADLHSSMLDARHSQPPPTLLVNFFFISIQC